jgi:hypothetical protein
MIPIPIIDDIQSVIHDYLTATVYVYRMLSGLPDMKVVVIGK